MGELRYRLPPDPRPSGTPPSLTARRFLFELESDGYEVILRAAPSRLHIRPGCPERLPELRRFAYELKQILLEQRS